VWKSLAYQVELPDSCSSAATDETPVPEVVRSTFAYWRASPGSGDRGSLDTSPYQRATSSPETL